MSLLHRTVVAAILFAMTLQPVLAAEKTEIESLVPSDAFVVIKVTDVPALHELFQTHPLKKFWEDAAVKAFFAPMRTQMEGEDMHKKIIDATGMTQEELNALPKGDIVFSFSGLEALAQSASAGTEPEPEIQVIVQISEEDHEKIRTLMEKLMEMGQKEAPVGVTLSQEPEEYRGFTLNTLKTTTESEVTESGAWALAGDLLVFSSKPEFLKKTLDRVAGDSSASLLDSANYSAVCQKTGTSQLLAFVDVEAIMNTLLPVLDAQQAANPGATPVNPPAVMRALGLDVMQGAYLALNLEESATTLDMGVNFTERKGLMKLMAFGNNPQFPAFIPADMSSASVMQFSIPEFWTALKEIAVNATPQGAMLPFALQQAGAPYSVNIEQDLIGALGNHIVMMGRTEPSAVEGQPPVGETIYAFHLADRARFEGAFNTLLTGAAQGGSLFTDRDFMGTNIRTLTMPAGAMGAGGEQFITLAFTDQYLLTGTGAAGALEGVLVQISKGGESLWDKTETRDALATLPTENASGFGYADIPTALDGMTQTFKPLAAMGLFGPNVLVDFNASPSEEVYRKYFGAMVSGIYMSDTSFSMKARLLHNTEGK